MLRGSAAGSLAVVCAADVSPSSESVNGIAETSSSEDEACSAAGGPVLRMVLVVLSSSGFLQKKV